MNEINVYDIISPAFYDLFDEVLQNKFTHYWLKGGRGSTKSSFIGIAIPLMMMLDAQNNIFSNAIALRKVGDTLADSVYAQIIWGIEMLGVTEFWQFKTSPLTLIYKPTGQMIKFRSAHNKDDYKKIKSTKFTKGFCKYIWFEELDEFFGMYEIRNILQSLLRGRSNYEVFYSYNPPKSVNSWVNAQVIVPREDKRVHTSNYLTVPRSWLGNEFFIEAEELKKSNELDYRNEYLGETTGTGGAIFTNVELVEITNEQINTFDNISDGLDFGYTIDPSCYTQNYYDRKNNSLYIFNEIYKTQLSNKKLYEEIIKVKVGKSDIYSDSAEPKSIDEINSYRKIHLVGVKKGPDSIEYGIKWLQKLKKIYIDPKRAPNTATEFTLYEYEKDRNGNFVAKYPDYGNHSIDATRYSREKEFKFNKMTFGINKIL